MGSGRLGTTERVPSPAIIMINTRDIGPHGFPFGAGGGFVVSINGDTGIVTLNYVSVGADPAGAAAAAQLAAEAASDPLGSAAAAEAAAKAASDPVGSAVTAQSNAESYALGLVASYIPLSERGANNGVAELNGSGQVPASELANADLSGAASAAQTAAESYAAGLVTTETGRAEAAEALLTPLSKIGAANGVAELDGSGQVPAGELGNVPVKSVNTQTGTVNLTAAEVGAEPALGNPSVSGQVLSSTLAGIRSWITISGSGLTQQQSMALQW